MPDITSNQFAAATWGCTREAANGILKIVLASSLIMASTMANSQSGLLAEIIKKKNLSANNALKIDVTEEVRKYIPPDSSAETAKETLLANGFTVTNHKANAKDFLLGKRTTDQSALGFHEINISVILINKKVASISGSVFWHTF